MLMLPTWMYSKGRWPIDGTPMIHVNLFVGSRVTVEWLKFLRPEQKFGGVEELRAQIARDRETAAAFFRPTAQP